MLTCDFLESIEKEISKRIFALENPELEEFSYQIWNQGIRSASTDDIKNLNMMLDFASSLDYNHAGLSPKAYLSHPVRVAGMILLLSSQLEKRILGTVGLLHNVLEVSKLNFLELELKTNSIIAGYIQILTVQRDLQENSEYLNDYYTKIASTPHSLSVVKIIDKLDNLFVLGLNPDENIRNRYLNEVENYLMPLVTIHLPQLTDYIKNLVEYNRRNGMIDRNKYL